MTATDAAGNTSPASVARTITIDTTVPVPPAPKLTAASDSGASPTDGITNVTMPTLIGTAEAGTVVKLYDGARYLGTATAGSNGFYSITTSANLANGQHAFNVTATNAAGNVSAASTALAVTIDTVAPTRSAAPTLAAGSDTGTSSTDGITNKATPTLTGTAEAGSNVTLYEGSAVLGTAVATDGTYTIASPTLRDGTHALTITATDTAGNVSAPSLARNVTIDTSAPGVAISSTGGTVTRGAQTITGTGEAGTSITLTDNGTALVGNDGNWTKRITLSSGNSIVAKDTDAAGNIGRAQQSITTTWSPPPRKCRACTT